jgi:hypothetical protein
MTSSPPSNILERRPWSRRTGGARQQTEFIDRLGAGSELDRRASQVVALDGDAVPLRFEAERLPAGR